MKDTQKLRGRPKTLKRDDVLQVAMLQYWEHGAPEVSINDICKIANVSKPSIYREFESDDGLKAAAFLSYKTMAIDPFLALLKTDQPLLKTLDDMISFLTQDREVLGIPKGCLFVGMRAQGSRFGPETVKFLGEVREYFLASLADWIDKSKQSGEFRKDIPTSIAVHQIDALHAGVMRMQKEGAEVEAIMGVLKFGLAAISGEARLLQEGDVHKQASSTH